MPLLSYPFRLFFLLTGLYGVVVIPAWLGLLFFGWPNPAGLPPLHWHVHEVLFGLVPAAIAGFLLTAMCTWTGAPPLRGAGLLALGALWLAGRLAFWFPTLLSPPVLLAIDTAFLLATALYAGTVIIGRRNWRNLVLVAVLVGLWLANLLMSLEMLGYLPPLRRAVDPALLLVLLLLTIVAGRIIPAFSANWLVKQGQARELIRQNPRVNQAALVVTALLLPLELLEGPLPALVALLAALLHGLRLAGWRGWLFRGEPLLWILHLGYAWIVVALLLKGVAGLSTAVPASAWFHALGVGAIGTLILGVMTRVCLGHTGRPLVLPAGASLIYWLITLSAVLRVAHALGATESRLWLFAAGLSWSLAFLLFVVLYWTILMQADPPRNTATLSR